MEQARLDGEGGDQALALVGDAGPALSAGSVGVLYGGGLARYERVLAVVDGAGVGIREPQVGSAGDSAVDGKRAPVVIAGRGTLEFVDGAELCDGAPERIDTGRIGAGQRLRELPGGKGIDGVISALKD